MLSFALSSFSVVFVLFTFYFEATTIINPLGKRQVMHILRVIWYPGQGFLYFIVRKQCWQYFFTHLKPLFIVAIVVYILAIPISLILVLATGGMILTVLPSILQSCNFIINFINKSIILPKILHKLFDCIVHEHIKDQYGYQYNKLPRGVLNPYLPGFYGETILGRTIRTSIRLGGPIWWIMKLILCFLVNMIPIVGPLLVIIIRADASGFGKHKRYFHLKGYSAAQIHYVWVHRWGQYFAFGFVALLMESIPVMGYLFVFTNVIGAAYWAVDIEREQRRVT